ncbi:MAG TPA: four helix bundle protein [Vicinamibacterales bacterium]|nr:four helix bundle protein [Vicinamibacterales bacterium]
MEPARNIKELIAWQLGSRLSDVVEQMVGKPQARQNPRLCEQIRASSDSVPANLAEGFGRYYPRENARFVRIAKASLTETQNHLQAGNRRDYWTAGDFEKAWRLSCRAMKAIVGYLRYLEGCHGELPPPKPPEPSAENQ